MTIEVKNISVRAYAEHLKVSDKTVRNAIADGKLKKGVLYRTQIRKGQQIEVPEINKDIADKEWGFLHQTGKQKPGQSKNKINDDAATKITDKPEKHSADLGADLPENDDLDGLTEDGLVSTLKVRKSTTFKEAVRLREVFAAQLDKLKLQELEGTLVKKADVEKSLFAFGDEIKKEFLNIPARCIDEIMATKNKVEAINILHIEIENVLNKLTSGHI